MLHRASPVAAALVLSLAAGCDLSSSAREARIDDAYANSAEDPKEAAAAQSVITPPGNSSPGATSPAPGAAIEATFDDIKFDMEKTERFERSMLTPKVESLFNQRIRIRGYIYPTLRKRGLTQFVLVRDNMECCFGPGAALFDCIVVTMAPGKTAEYTIRPVAVEGIFRLEELPGPEGRPLAIYQMVGEKVE